MCLLQQKSVSKAFKREFQRFGDRILLGGDMFEDHQPFLKWAGQYDTGGMDMRSTLHHGEWLKLAICLVIKVDGTAAVEAMPQGIGFSL